MALAGFYGQIDTSQVQRTNAIPRHGAFGFGPSVVAPAASLSVPSLCFHVEMAQYFQWILPESQFACDNRLTFRTD